MRTKDTTTIRTALAAVVILVVAAAVPATSAEPQAKPGPAVTLEYKMPSGRSLTYQYKSDTGQVMEIQGQGMDSQISSTNTVTFKPKGLKDKNLLLSASIDDIAMSMTSSMTGDMSPDTASIKGKSFDMTLSPLGAEVDVAGAEALTYSVSGESQDISSEFKVFFPDLPGKPVKIGDTWPSNDGFEQKSTSMSLRFDTKYINTLEGFETIDGMECARVSGQITGTVAGSGSQGGMDLTMSGTSKGKVVWYFAVKEGVFVKATTETTSEVSVDLSAAGMTIPVTGTVKTEIKLTGKA
jgi:hypothetical protein